MRRNRKDDPDHLCFKEMRSFKKILTDRDIYAIEKLMWDYGFEARALTRPPSPQK
jgi:hypothetical protein